MRLFIFFFFLILTNPPPAPTRNGPIVDRHIVARGGRGGGGGGSGGVSAAAIAAVGVSPNVNVLTQSNTVIIQQTVVQPQVTIVQQNLDLVNQLAITAEQEFSALVQAQLALVQEVETIKNNIRVNHFLARFSQVVSTLLHFLGATYTCSLSSPFSVSPESNSAFSRTLSLSV